MHYIVSVFIYICTVLGPLLLQFLTLYNGPYEQSLQLKDTKLYSVNDEYEKKLTYSLELSKALLII